MRPEFVFDVCHGLYEALRDLPSQRIPTAGSSLEAGVPHDRNPRPQRLPRPADFTADFALAGEAALAGRPSRLVLFRVHYLGGAEYERARRHLGISPEGWAQWTEEIRRRVGQELLRRGLFPPRRYFQEPTRPWEAGQA